MVKVAWLHHQSFRIDLWTRLFELAAIKGRLSRGDLERIEFNYSSFVNRHSTILKLAGFQLFAEKPDLFSNGAVLLDTALNAVYGMQRGRMIAVE